MDTWCVEPSVGSGSEVGGALSADCGGVALLGGGGSRPPHISFLGGGSVDSRDTGFRLGLTTTSWTAGASRFRARGPPVTDGAVFSLSRGRRSTRVRMDEEGVWDENERGWGHMAHVGSLCAGVAEVWE